MDVKENSITYSTHRDQNLQVLTSTATQTPASFTQISPSKVKLRYTIRLLKRNNTSKAKQQLFKTQHDKSDLKIFEGPCDKFLNKAVAQLLKIQAKLKNKSGRAKRYSKEYKKFALTLYFLGPKSYRFLSKILYCQLNAFYSIRL